MLTLGKIDHIHIRVGDVAAALKWYQRVLALTPDTRYKTDGEHNAAMLVNSSGSVRLAIGEDADAVPSSQGAVAFVVGGQDFVEWIDRLAGERVTNREGQSIARDSVRDHRFFCALSFVDPFGNPFEIVSYDHTWLVGKLKLGGQLAV
ncbi:VOC family protein [Chromobacterium sphagni]|uniref:Glyoxalase n=1 Tax=Chromobacterium sphagni TaxID=1903179 RepID=A0A1S1X5A3_9NEIS|nr:VOC family protein [Chromobacterium sphagni]OHX14661.1 glyoxalase [Chromobacterium sphagni]OHX20019.1 glyoxalase [Chromobacterium sphagni]